MKFTVEGEPRPKGRPRKGAHGNFYTPRETQAYEDLVAWVAKAEPERFERQMCSLKVDFYVTALLGSGNAPDLDNLVKSLCDGIEKSGVIANDNQILHAVVGMYQAGGENGAPRAEVELLPLEQQNV